ncbi:MAG: methylenetetrahydrofolate reductase [NAD(P)H] [Gammaproteobacteria bacterium]|nr:methylenetetrahydrofolate reductase [NAD(P)H] [Gammaproteobacteria bacterium]MDH5777015.1 methylenetetrahydrofolate reductase [NAD(P)H] [Gammaproteobacteria bacterium]
MESQKDFPQTFSFEFFPPKSDEGAEKLRKVRDELAKLNPLYFSVTFGAGGSTQQGTADAVIEIQKSGSNAAPHLSCIGSSKESIRELLNLYKDNDIKRIVALRGDMPSGMQSAGEFRHANELVEFIRKETGDHFHIEVAAYPEFHPQANDAETDLKNFKRKIDAGANSALTQYFYNIDAYINFVEDCEDMGVSVPIVPGIMPITNYKQLARFSDMCGAEIPRWIRKRLEGFGDDIESLRAFGLDVTAELCHELLEVGAPGLHFYTMNQTGPTMAIWEALGLGDAPSN